MPYLRAIGWIAFIAILTACPLVANWASSTRSWWFPYVPLFLAIFYTTCAVLRRSLVILQVMIAAMVLMPNLSFYGYYEFAFTVFLFVIGIVMARPVTQRTVDPSILETCRDDP